MWDEHLLQKFENTKYLQKINSAPRQASACPIESEDFASFLRNIFASSSPLIPSNLDKEQIQRIPQFQMEELDIALQSMVNLKSADESGIVIEMVKHATNTFKENLVSLFNQTLMDASFEDSWYVTILQMLSKDGDLNELNNWRPIAILQIFYKIYSKLVYNRISPYLFKHQSWDQHGFTLGIRIEDALLCAEVAIEHHLEFQLPMWMLSMDMRKAFDTIDHSALMQSLRSKGLPEEYISLLTILYADQKGVVNHSSEFLIQRGVKQGDTLSAILFNCILDMAFDLWLASLTHEGIFIAHGLSRLTNIRYADDILLYAKSLDELVSMAEGLLDEMKKIGLSLNDTKTKVLRCFPSDEDSSINVIEIFGELIKILDEEDSHRYLGRQLCTSPSDRVNIEVNIRIRAAWEAFHKHKCVLLDHNISLRLRLKMNAANIGPALLFGTSVLPMTKHHLQKFDILQRKMLRRIVGWRRIDGEEWKDTMKRMNDRLEEAQRLFFCEPWSMIFARSQWRYVKHLMDAYPLLWARIMIKFNKYSTDDPECDFLPYRTPGHPRMRWDDHIHSFCYKIWPRLRGRHWFDILCHQDVASYEDEFILHIANL